MAETLEIIITVVDNATKALDKIGDTAKKSFTKAMKIGAIGATGLTVALGASIKMAFDAEESFAKLNSVIESTGGVAGVTIGEAQALADSLAKVTRFSDEQIESVETLLLTFTNIGEDVFPLATETVLNMGEAFGSTDSAAIQLGKALNDPITGIGALAEVGVSFTEEQKEMVAAMVEAGDIAGAQAVILDELEKEFGGMARAAGDTAAGKLVIFKNQLIDVAQAIGSIFLPMITRVLDRALLPLAENFQTAADNIPVLIRQFEGLVGAAREFGIESVAFQAMLDIFGIPFADKIVMVVLAFEQLRDTLIGFVNDTVIPFVQAHLPAFKAAFLAVGAVIGGAVVLGGILTLIGVLTSLLTPLNLIIAAIGILAFAWEEDWLGIRTAVTDAWNNHIKPALDEVLGFIETTFGPDLQKIWDGIKNQNVDEITDGINGILETMQGLIDTWGPLLADTLSAVADEFVQWVPGAIERLLEKLGALIEIVGQWIVDNAPAIAEKLMEWVGKFADWVLIAGAFMMEQFGILLTNIGTWITETAAPAIGEQLLIWAEAFWAWIPGALVSILEKFGELLAGVINWIVDDAGTQIPDALKAWGSAFVDWIAPIVVSVIEALGTLLANIINWIADTAVPLIVDEATKIGGALIDGIRNGITAAWDEFSGFVTGLLDQLISDALDVFGIGSPSRVFMDIGQNIVEGMRIGLEGFEPTLTAGVIAPSVATVGASAQLANQTTNNFTQIVNTSAPAEDIASDFNLMQAFAR
jgi:hypothetical protein